MRPSHSSFDVVLEWTPQRRVWTAVWISVLAALLCLAIVGGALLRRRVRASVAAPDASDSTVWIEWPVPARRDPSALPEPAHRRRDQIGVPVLAGLAAALIVAPWVGVVVAGLMLAMQWRPRVRAVLVLGPAVFLTLVTVYMVYLQHHFRFPPLFEWPTLFPLARPLGWLAVVFLGVDVLVERVRGGAGPGRDTGPVARPGP